MTDASAYRDLSAYTALARLTGLALAPDGSRLVVTVQQPDAKGARYSSAVWEIPLDGAGEPVRLTRSEQGETAPAFLPDGRLVFASSRPDGDEKSDDSALWALGPAGEPSVFARRPGGLSAPVVAASSGHVLAAGSQLRWTHDDADDEQRRATRSDRKITAILHTGMPIRYWDHELGVESPRLLLIDPLSGEQRDLVPDATTELVNSDCSISADGSRVAATWHVRGPKGRDTSHVALVDVATGHRDTIEAPDGYEFEGPQISPDGRRVAVARDRLATFETPPETTVQIHGDDTMVDVDLGDVWPSEYVWTPDSRQLVVSGNRLGRGAVLLVDASTGQVVRRLACDAVYAALAPTPDGTSVYALRSAMDEAARPVRLDLAAADQDAVRLPTPAPTPELPGRLVELDVPVDGVDVHAWLFLPPEGGAPAPVMQWIHGGPFMSYNSWSWRWNPWVAVAHGWAVILPDPALSTGYGPTCLERAWPYRADVVWHEVEGVLDHVLSTRDDVDAERTALLGASFGGFMTNWIAGHTDRFDAVVTHAGLWALDQQHATTDAADYKTGVFGRLAEHPGWYADYSPHNFVERISSPMLVIHGNRDYRVPVSEALRLWWDLVNHHEGDPEDFPHRFLQLTGENHWVLSPANGEIWYDTVLGFCAHHVLDEDWTLSPLL